jgi:hypothetical protein
MWLHPGNIRGSYGRNSTYTTKKKKHLIMLRWQGGRCTQFVDPQNQVVVLTPILREEVSLLVRAGSVKGIDEE